MRIEGNRKLIVAVVALIGATVAVCIRAITADQFQAIAIWAAGMFVGGNVIERAMTTFKRKPDA